MIPVEGHTPPRLGWLAEYWDVLVALAPLFALFLCAALEVGR